MSGSGGAKRSCTALRNHTWTRIIKNLEIFIFEWFPHLINISSSPDSAVTQYFPSYNFSASHRFSSSPAVLFTNRLFTSDSSTDFCLQPPRSRRVHFVAKLLHNCLRKAEKLARAAKNDTLRSTHHSGRVLKSMLRNVRTIKIKETLVHVPVRVLVWVMWWNVHKLASTRAEKPNKTNRRTPEVLIACHIVNPEAWSVPLLVSSTQPWLTSEATRHNKRFTATATFVDQTTPYRATRSESESTIDTNRVISADND